MQIMLGKFDVNLNSYHSTPNISRAQIIVQYVLGIAATALMVALLCYVFERGRMDREQKDFVEYCDRSIQRQCKVSISWSSTRTD